MAAPSAAVAAAAAAASATTRAPPRYAAPVGAWPDATLAALLAVPPRTADPRQPNLLQDAAQAAEAHEAVAEMTSDPEALARLRALLAEAPRHFQNNDPEFALGSQARFGAHGAASPAAGLLAALLAQDPHAFDAGAAPTTAAPLRSAAPSPKKRRRTGSMRGAGAASPSAAPAPDMQDKGAPIAEGDVPTLKAGDKLWLRWDDPKAALHNEWLAATVGAQPVCEGGKIDAEWTGYFVLQFQRQQIDMADKAFDLTRYAKLKRLRFALPSSTLVQKSPQAGGPPSVSPTPTAAAKKRSTKRQHAPVAISTDSAATVASRLRKHVDGILERAPEQADQLSSAGDQEAVITASDAKKILDDVMSLKSRGGEGRAQKVIREDGQKEEDDATSVWGIEAKEWHTVLLVLDRFIQAGIQRVEAGAGPESLGYMDAALIILHIATLADRPKELLISETIDTVLLGAKRVLDCIVFPVFTPSAIRPDQQVAAAGPKASPTKTAPKSPAKGKTAAAVKAASSVSQVLHRLGDLCQKESLEDGMICSLSSLGISTITAEGAEMAPLQASGVQLLCTVAKRYRSHREMVFNEAFEALPKLSGLAKKNIRQFRVSDGVSIQTISALFLGLVQASVGAPPGPSSTAFQSEWDKSRTDYAEALVIAKTFVSKFIKKCLVKKEDRDVRVVLERFIVDMCTVLNWPAWPAAESALRILALMMTHELKVPAAAIPKQADSSYRGFLIDMVGTITCMVYRQCGAEIVDDDALRDATDDEDHAVRIRSAQQTMLVSYLRNYDSSDSVPFLLNLWLADGDTADEERQQQLSGLSDDESKPMAIEDSLEDVRAASLELARSRDLLKMKSVLLERIVAMFQDNNITLRSKAMKVLSNLIEVCEAIFADEKVKSAVKKNLYDAAVSVREAAVDMVGKAMALNPTHSNSYLDLILERILDTGKSVRKRCVRILYETLCSQPTHSSSTKILLKLATRAEDDDSIREIVLGTFRDLWFNPEVRAIAASQVALQLDTRQSGVGADTAITCDVPVLTLAQRVKQMLDFMAVSTVADRTRLVAVFNALLGRSDREGDTRKFGHMAALVSTEQIAELCGKMCDQLIEVLLRDDEAEGMDEVEGIAPVQTNSKRLAVRTSCILAMQIFCQTGADFLVGHMTTLQPYLKLPPGASNEDCIMVQYAAYMIYECLPIAQNLDQSFKQALANDLLTILNESGNLQVLHICAKCLCALFQYTDLDDGMLRKVLRSFLTSLTRVVDKLAADGTNFEVPLHACKSIYIMGCLCRHYDFEEKGRPSSMMDLVVAVCLRCAKPQSSEVGRRFAIGALGHIACRTPDLLLQDEPRKIMEAAMNAKSSHIIKTQVLKSLSEVLVDEERKNTRGSGANTGRTGKKFTDTADDSKVKTDEMGLSGGLMQRYLAQLLSLSHDVNANVRYDAMNLIRVILRQGLVHPIECVTNVVALAGDKETRVRAQAEKLIAYLDDKHHSMLALRSVEGVTKCYEFQLRVFKAGSAFIDSTQAGPICAFAQLYAYLRTKKSEGKQFVNNLLNKIVDGIKSLSDRNETTPTEDVDLRFLSYIVSVISSLPYNKKDEVMTILGALTRSISLHGEPLELALKEAMTSDSSGTAAEATEQEEATSAAAHLLRPMQRKCTAATVVCMLIQLKSHIQNCYGVSDSQVTANMDTPGNSNGRFDVQIMRRSDRLFKLNDKTVLDQPHGATETEADSVLWARYTQLKAALQDDGAQADYLSSSGQAGQAATSPNSRGGRPAGGAKRGRNSASKAKAAAKAAKASKKKKKKPKRRKRLSDVSDDSGSEDAGQSDDSDYEG
jgi:cohesin loading factor subunit SCC2